MKHIGFVGLGIMGTRIVKRLLGAGYVVTGYNRTQSKAQSLLDSGMQWATTPRDVAKAADITISMVSDTAALSSVAQGPDGILAGLSAGKVYIDMSTVSPALIRVLAKQVAGQGAQMLEAPVSGSVPAAESGTLVMYVGGETVTLEAARPILENLSQKIIHVGPNGQGVSMKIAINLNLAVQLLSLFESLILAERSGISRQMALDSLLNSVAASPAMKYRAPFVFKMPDEVWFSVKMLQKDLKLALDMGQELNVPLETVAHANEVLSAARAMGYGDSDFAAMFHVVRTMAGVAE